MRNEMRDEPKDEVIINCEIKQQSEKSIMVIGFKGEDVWLEKSQIEIISLEQSFEGVFVELKMSTQLMLEKGII